MTFPDKQSLDLKQAELAEKYAKENIELGNLKGSVFVRDNKKIGMVSLNFDEVEGPYLSYENEKSSKLKFENGNLIPPRLRFSEYSFDETERRFIGIVEYAGNCIDGVEKARYEMSFDTKYVCVVSGQIVHIKEDQGEKSKVFGDDVIYINTDQSTVDKDTAKRLETEGATAKTIDVFRGPTCKYDNRMVNDNVFVWTKISMMRCCRLVLNVDLYTFYLIFIRLMLFLLYYVPI